MHYKLACFRVAYDSEVSLAWVEHADFFKIFLRQGPPRSKVAIYISYTAKGEVANEFQEDDDY